jgi:SAM-dependent methyltransferase
MPQDRRRHADATLRNREPILQVLQSILPVEGTLLEIASGTGEHAAHLAARMPRIVWIPTDADEGAVESIAAWRAAEGGPNLEAPRLLDVRDQDWGVSGLDAILCVNMIHISPWECTEALMRGAARALKPGGLLYLYGPFMIDGLHTAPSNERFDRMLLMQDPSWGVRDLGAVVDTALAEGLALDGDVEMPANNRSVWFRRPPSVG